MISRAQPLNVFTICTAIALLDGLDVQLMGVTAPAIAREWGLPAHAFGTVFTAAPAGMLAGALALGRLADRIGRKVPIVAATFLFALFTILTAFSPSVEVMAAIRFCAGFGLGGVLPNLVSLVTESAPPHARGRITTLTFSTLPLGAMSAAMLARWLIPAFGWRSLFVVGGVLPALVGAIAALRLPESSAHLDSQRQRMGGAFADLLGPGRTPTTLLLVVVATLNLFMLYFTMNWLPTLLREAGLSADRALLATVLVNAGGGIGAIAWGVLMDRFGRLRIMAISGLAAFAAMAVVGLAHNEPGLLLPALFVAGMCIMGAVPALYAVVGAIYPAPIRSTGIGVVLGAGRIGSILGPAAGATLIAANWTVPAIFMAVAALGVLWASGIWIVARLPRAFA